MPPTGFSKEKDVAGVAVFRTRIALEGLAH